MANDYRFSNESMEESIWIKNADNYIVTLENNHTYYATVTHYYDGSTLAKYAEISVDPKIKISPDFRFYNKDNIEKYIELDQNSRVVSMQSLFEFFCK